MGLDPQSSLLGMSIFLAYGDTKKIPGQARNDKGLIAFATRGATTVVERFWHPWRGWDAKESAPSEAVVLHR